MLESHVNANRFNKWVVLSSLGGDDVFEAMKAGKFIRERGLYTTAVGNCESACGLVYVGGTSREVGSELFGETVFGRLGFHRLIVEGIPLPERSSLYQDIHNYYDSMGIDAEMVINFMTANPGSQMYWPDAQQLCAADLIGLATSNDSAVDIFNGQSECQGMKYLENNKIFIVP
jgi:hypothetical protein